MPQMLFPRLERARGTRGVRAAFNPLLLGKLKPSKWKDISCNFEKLQAGGDQSSVKWQSKDLQV